MLGIQLCQTGYSCVKMKTLFSFIYYIVDKNVIIIHEDSGEDKIKLITLIYWELYE